MARVSYRRRPDGILEIVRPRPWERAGAQLKIMAVALAALAVLAGATIRRGIGAPFLLLVTCLGFAWLLWRSGGQRSRPAARDVRERRTAP